MKIFFCSYTYEWKRQHECTVVADSEDSAICQALNTFENTDPSFWSAVEIDITKSGVYF